MRPLSWLSTLAIWVVGTSAAPVSSSSSTADFTISRITMINNSSQDFVRFMFAFIPAGHGNDPRVFWSELTEVDSKDSETLSLNSQDNVMVRFDVNEAQGAGASGPIFLVSKASTCTVTLQADDSTTTPHGLTYDFTAVQC
ncbi:hypothetical protein L218DRAFT_177841 [Marasmius fiardii PR-910]|nr:hypothetical protein L218DRAFT_177841 [Marasmius fiardii PR-910]